MIFRLLGKVINLKDDKSSWILTKIYKSQKSQSYYIYIQTFFDL